MTLPKHLRPRWRYLALGLRSWPDVVLERAAVEAAFQRSARQLFGDAGEARTTIRLMHWSWTDGTGEAVVRTRREAVCRTRAAIACTAKIEDAPVGINVRGVSGTVRACEENYLGGGTEPKSEKTVDFEGAERPALARGRDVDVRVDDAFVGATRLDLE